MQVCGRNLTLSAKCEALLTMASRSAFAVTVETSQTSHGVILVGISESNIINQSISINRFYPNEG